MGVFQTRKRLQECGSSCERVMERFAWHLLPLMFGMLGLAVGYVTCLALLLRTLLLEPVLLVRDVILTSDSP